MSTNKFEPQPSKQEGINILTRRTIPSVWVTFDKVGFHCYPNAPEEVAYLRDRHRHVFKFKVRISVFHDDREIEFHMLKNWLTGLYDGELEVDYKSCEMLAKELLDKIIAKYDCAERSVLVDVSEDGECGATIESHPDRRVNLPESFLQQAGYRKDVGSVEQGSM